MTIRTGFAFARMLAVFLAVGACATPLGAAEWQVARSTGDVWVATPKAQPVSLGADVVLRPGDKIQTGRTGRVLLVRGTESILVAPNSAVSLPEELKPTLATTILHQAGSIVLEVEKKGAEHFEVETPFLAAVVKGTRFAVTVNRYGAEVRVLDGKVSVSDLKTGRFALVAAGQVASVAASGKGGLTLGGPGQLSPVQQGDPRKTHLERVPVPARGLGPPHQAPGGVMRAAAAQLDGRVRIVTPIGLGKLDVGALTNGLARGQDSSPPAGRGGKGRGSTAWNGEASGVGADASQLGGGNGNGGGISNAGGPGNANGSANGKGAANGKAKDKNK
jgi:hypothetical protein